eukprot:gene28665-35564_t
MAAKNAERLARVEEKDLIGKTFPMETLRSFSRTVLDSNADTASALLQQSGALGLKGVLSSETADRLLQYINDESLRAKKEVEDGAIEFDERFGGVNCRGDGLFGNRQDQYLPMSSEVVRESLSEVIQSLGPILEAAVTREGMVHEVSSLVADPGSPRQCVHADTIYLPCRQYPVEMAPLYTFFIALQDVEDDMGHTTFLLQTHTENAHALWNTSPRQKQ